MSNETLYLQQMMESYKRPTKVLAITGSKGGVGKTSIAANLAICLSAPLKKILVEDECLDFAVRLRKPVVLAYPKSHITSSPVALAAKSSNGLAAQPDDEGFFKKVVDWFF